MKSVFISYYSSADRPFVNALRELLVAKEYELLDVQEQGDRLFDSTLSAIQRAGVVVALIGKQSANVLFEVGIAIGANKPVLLVAGPEDEIPFDLARFRVFRAQLTSRDLVLEVFRNIEAMDFEKTDFDVERLTIQELMAMLRRKPEVLNSINPRKFEELVAAVYSSMGFDVRSTRESMDGGIDFILVRPRGGTVALQVKRRNLNAKVSAAEVREFLGATALRGADRGIFVTTSSFTSAANQLVKNSPIPIELLTIQELMEKVQS